MIGRTKLIACALFSTLAIAAVTPAAAQPVATVAASESRSKVTNPNTLAADNTLSYEHRRTVTAHRGLATFAFGDAAADRLQRTHVLRNGSASFRGDAAWHSDGGTVIKAVPVSIKH